MSEATALARGLALSGVPLLTACSVALADDGGVAPVVRWERPPEGTMERGLLGVPEWVVVLVGAVVVVLAAVALVASARRARSAR